MKEGNRQTRLFSLCPHGLSLFFSPYLFTCIATEKILRERGFPVSLTLAVPSQTGGTNNHELLPRFTAESSPRLLRLLPLKPLPPKPRRPGGGSPQNAAGCRLWPLPAEGISPGKGVQVPSHWCGFEMPYLLLLLLRAPVRLTHGCGKKSTDHRVIKERVGFCNRHPSGFHETLRLEPLFRITDI